MESMSMKRFDCHFSNSDNQLVMRMDIVVDNSMCVMAMTSFFIDDVEITRDDYDRIMRALGVRRMDGWSVTEVP
jgi:hypothetical protein